MDWQAHRHDWPHAEFSRFIEARGVRWHVQQAGQQGPKVLLIHGTGASGHTWRDLLCPLAEHLQVWVVDLPGHGFSSLATGQGMSMGGMADCLHTLMQTLEVPVDVFIGHSAGAAIAAGAFKDEIAAVNIVGKKGDTTVVDTDEEPARGNPAKFAVLRPSFDKAGTITAANASSLNDGAAALVLCSADKAKALGKQPIARILAYATHA